MKTREELLREQQELHAQLATVKAGSEQERELKRKYEANKREWEMLKMAEQKPAQREEHNPGQVLREVLAGARKDKQAREITLGTEIAASGAQTLTIHDMIPTLNEGLGLPGSLNIVTGVVGNEIYPVSVNDAEMEELGENANLTDQKIDFDKIVPVARRCGLTIWVSNSAIDNAAFDLLGFVQKKFTIAQKKYLAKKLYSQAAFTGNHGPFKGLASKDTITIGSGAYASILKMVAEFTDKGFDQEGVCIVMDATTEAELKATPKADGQGGFVIENGKCAGYDYVVSHYINTELDTDGKTLKPTAKKYIGVGYFGYEAVQQHGAVRMTIDATSNAVAIANKTAVTLNTEWSFTDLSVKQNKYGGTTTQAFAIYEVATA